MAIIEGVLTDTARKWWPQMFGGLTTFKPISRFVVGEGGWQDDGTGVKVRRTPDPALNHLDIVENPSRYGPGSIDPNSVASYSKALVSTDFTFVSPTTLQVTLLLDFTEFNDDGLGNNPEIWEIGLFSEWPDYPTTSNPVTGANEMLVAYGTVDKQIKDSGKQLQNLFILTF